MSVCLNWSPSNTRQSHNCPVRAANYSVYLRTIRTKHNCPSSDFFTDQVRAKEEFLEINISEHTSFSIVSPFNSEPAATNQSPGISCQMLLLTYWILPERSVCVCLCVNAEHWVKIRRFRWRPFFQTSAFLRYNFILIISNYELRAQ